MSVGTMAISGLVASQIDIESIITQLAQIKQAPIQNLEAEQEAYQSKLTAFGQLTARVLSLSAAATSLTADSAFSEVSAASSNESAVVMSASAGAPVGTYDISVDQLAQTHKVRSDTVASTTEALGYEGEVLLGGEVVSIQASDGLADIRDAIKAAGGGATASILTVGDGDYRLTVSSLSSGSEGALELIDANAAGILESLGINSSSTSVKHAITNGAAGDALADRLSTVGDVYGLSSAPSGTVQINGTDVAIDLSTDSLEDIASAISAVDGVTATVENVEVDGETAYRLEIVGDSGQPTFTDDNNVLTTLGVLEKGYGNEVDAAQDAQFSIDGVSMTRSTNAVDDAIENVQLQLLQTTGTEDVTLTVEADTGATVSAVESFVNAYNSVIDFVNQNQHYDTDSEQGGLFFGTPAVTNLEAGLRDQVSNLVDSLGGDYVLASQLGITFNSSDQMVFDSSEFLQALESDPEAVRRMFDLRTEASSGEIEVMDVTSATQDSGSEGYAVQITQVATRATAVSAAMSGGITMDETLTINGKAVTLTDGMTLQEAADQLNALFSAQNMDINASVDGDTIVIEHELYGSAREIEIVSSLDDGVGGTDLGGATAGEAATYAGQDVAGTIDGVAATGYARLLTASDDSDAGGLQLVVTSETTGDRGTVHVSRGIASRLAAYTEAVTDEDTGSLTRAAETASDEIDAIDEQIAELEDELQRYIEELQADFSQMESKMQESLTLLDWMENQVNSLTRNND